MLGKSPLWVAKQHGHSPTTMLRTYAAWTEGAPESEVVAIRRAVEATAKGNTDLAVDLSLRIKRRDVSPREIWENHGGEGGIRTAADLTQPTDAVDIYGSR
jgi:hypothetical protein